MSTWYILTLAHRVRGPFSVPIEKLVMDNLKAGLGLTSYFPYEQKRVVLSNKCIERKVPLIGGVLFITGEYGIPWPDVLQTLYVTGRYGLTDEVPYPLSSAEIERIMQMEREHNRARVARPSQIGVGSRVRVTKGPFESIESLIMEVRGSTATIEAKMLGSTRSVQVPLAQLAEAS